jgi:hypothetical protein
VAAGGTSSASLFAPDAPPWTRSRGRNDRAHEKQISHPSSSGSSCRVPRQTGHALVYHLIESPRLIHSDWRTDPAWPLIPDYSSLTGAAQGAPWKDTELSHGGAKTRAPAGGGAHSARSCGQDTRGSVPMVATYCMKSLPSVRSGSRMRYPGREPHGVAATTYRRVIAPSDVA